MSADAASGDGAGTQEPRRHRAWPLAVGAAAGFAFGIVAGPAAAEVAIVGDLFLLALRMVVVPLVLVSLVAAVASWGDLRGVGRAAKVMVVYGLGTMLAATTLGVLLVTSIRPGVGVVIEGAAAAPAVAVSRAEEGFWQTLQDMLRSFVSPNVFTSMSSDPPGILAVIVFALALGWALAAAGEKARPARDLFEALDDAISRIVRLIVRAAPFGVAALIAARIGKAGGGAAALRDLGALALYSATVVAGLLIHALVVLPLVLRLAGGRRPVAYARGMVPAFLTAFATASSAATLPVTLQCLTGTNGVSTRAARFVVPLGATLNMNGTALYEAVAAVFIAQAHGIELGPAQLGIVAVTATLAAIGASAVPEAGLVTMVIVLEAVGLPIEGIGLILAVDWILDRCRTTVNVWDDGVGAAVVERVAMPAH